MSHPTGLNRYGESKKAHKKIEIRTSAGMAFLSTARGVYPLRYFQSVESLNRNQDRASLYGRIFQCQKVHRYVLPASGPMCAIFYTGLFLKDALLFL